MPKGKKVRKTYASSSSFGKIYGRPQKVPKRMPNKKVFVKE